MASNKKRIKAVAGQAIVSGRASGAAKVGKPVSGRATGSGQGRGEVRAGAAPITLNGGGRLA